MASFDEIQQYCDTVCGQIRWKKAKPLIEKELKDHLYDQKQNSYSRMLLPWTPPG